MAEVPEVAQVAESRTENERPSHLLQLEELKKRNFSEMERQILDILAPAITTATQEAAAEAATQLDAWCPPLDQYNEVQEYMWAIWEIMTDVAGSYEVKSDAQQGIIYILQALKQIPKGHVDVYGSEAFRERVWMDLPLFRVCFDASFNDPTLDGAEEGAFTPKSAQKWRNMNRFGAFCLGTGVLGPYPQAMYALRSALEEQPSPISEVVECRLKVACDWVLHSARPLLWWAQENLGYTDVPVEDTAAHEPGGELYEGPQTMCLRRWGFWLQRFESFGREAEGSGLSEEVRREALDAAEFMKTVERQIGHSL